jgi:hypothetical protein
MGSLKISLHGSGVCRVALTDRLYSALPGIGLSQPAGRALIKWNRAEIPERGAVHLMSAIFPSDHLVLPEPTATYRKPLLIFGDPPAGRAIEFGFFVSRENLFAMEERFLRIGKPIVGSLLDDGNTVTVVVRETDFDPSVLPPQERLESSTCTVLSPELYAIQGVQGGFGGLFWTKPKDGEALFLYEIGELSLRRNP